MEEVTILFIHTAYRVQSHQWILNENGLVLYKEEEIQPSEVYPRFIIDYPMFKVCRVEVCKRITNTDLESEKAYRWVSLERFK